MPIVTDKHLLLDYDLANPGAYYTVTIGLDPAISCPHVVSLLFDSTYMRWYIGTEEQEGRKEFTLAAAETITLQVKFRREPTSIIFPPMSYTVRSEYAPAWATVTGDIIIDPHVFSSRNPVTWLYIWHRVLKVFGT